MKKILDNKGKEIREYDVLKVFHFVGARKGRYYMYKHVTIRDGELYGLHLSRLNAGESDGFPLWVVSDNRVKEQGVFHDAEIVETYEGEDTPL